MRSSEVQRDEYTHNTITPTLLKKYRLMACSAKTLLKAFVIHRAICGLTEPQTSIQAVLGFKSILSI